MNVESPVIGCVSPTADLWLRSFKRLEIANDLLGEVFVPELNYTRNSEVCSDPDLEPNVNPNFQRILIGEKLGDFREQECGCTSTFSNPNVGPCDGQSELTCKYPCPADPGENSPRGFGGGSRFAPVGRVRIAQPSALAGYVVVNAAGTHEYPDCDEQGDVSTARRFWTGKVDVARLNGADRVLQPIGVGCCLTAQPVHTRFVSLIGNGDAGEIPFRIHYESSKPASIRHCAADGGLIFESTIIDATAQNITPIYVRYDGPLANGSGAGQGGPSIMNFEFLDESVNPPVWVPTLNFAASVCMDDPREVRIVGTLVGDSPQYLVDPFAPLRVRAIPERGGGTNHGRTLLCNPLARIGTIEVPIGAEVPVSDEIFYFTIVPDCNGNGTSDDQDIIDAAMLQGLVLDCDGNGLIDSCEIAANPDLDLDPLDGRLDRCDGPCPQVLTADYDISDAVDVLDLLAFIGDWTMNLGITVMPVAPGDFNSNGTVDLIDLLDFIGAWSSELGCSN